MNSLINLINTDIDIASFMLSKTKKQLESFKIGDYFLTIKITEKNFQTLKKDLENTVFYYENQIKMYGSIKKIIYEYFNKIS